jgi:hypothetical protein
MKYSRAFACVLLMLVSGLATSQQDGSLEIESVARSTSSAIRAQRSPEFLVARTSVEWAAAWKLPSIDQHGEATRAIQALPSVDFQRSMIVGIILPTSSDGCTGVTIHRAILSNEQVTVKYRERKPQSGDICTQSFATAYHFVKVSRSPLPVVFAEEQ